jgi:peptide/nickel transport system substrate-binding protein
MNSPVSNRHRGRASRTAASAICLAVWGFAAPLHAQSITVALASDIRSTNPGVNRDDITDGVVLNMVEGLVGYRDNGNVAPLLAEKFDVSPDGRTYTFKLRKGVKFHNGATLTSADVLWSWNRYMDPKTEWRCLSDFNGRNGTKVESASAPDASTFVMTIDKPSGIFLANLARTDCGMTAILHKDSLNPDGTWKAPIGTGPFKFVAWKRAQFVQLARFDDYVSPPGDKIDGYVGSKRPLLKEVKILIVPDSAAVTGGLLSGGIDAAQVPTSDFAELRKNPKIVAEFSPVASKHSLAIQTRDPLLSDVRMRQAIAAALDMDQLVAGASDNLGKPANSAVYRTSSYYSDVQKHGFVHDPAKARRLLKEAGYKGQTITLLANKQPNLPNFSMAVIAQAMMQSVGINAQVEVLEWATQLDRFNSGKYQMMAISVSAQLDTALSFDQFMGSKTQQARKIWDSPKAQALLDRALVSSDVAERQKVFDELHRQMIDDAALIIAYGGLGQQAHTTRVKGTFFWQGKLRLWETSVAQ